MGDAPDLISADQAALCQEDDRGKDFMGSQGKEDEGLVSDLAEGDTRASIKSEGGVAASNGVRKSSPKVVEKRNSTGSIGKGSPAQSIGKGSPAQTTPRLKASRSNFTVPQPFSLTTEKRASLGVKSQDNNASPAQTSTSSRAQVAKKAESPVQYQANASSAGVTSKSNVEFVFKSDERAQKRMEFYANLSEKSKAREAERNRMQAKSQQQIAAEIRKLRKDQSFKATPMPKFYQEPPPARVDVKKTPPTRPKSPKLGRRGSTDRPSSGGPPKIIARRSSDEYQVSGKAAEQEEQPVKSVVEAGKGQAPHEELDNQDKASEQSSSSKSGMVSVPKAALSGEDSPLQSQEERQEVLELSRSSDDLSQFDGILQLPVSSSLLNDEYDEEEGSNNLSDPGDENHFGDLVHQQQQQSQTSQQEDEHLGHEGDEQDETLSSSHEDVRVYISEEFRQAAAGEGHEYPPEDAEEEQAKVYVK